MHFSVSIDNSTVVFPCSEEETVLRAMEHAGKRGIPIGCRQGGCGVCKIEVLEGNFHARVMSRAHVSVEDQARGQVLACCIRPASDLCIRVLNPKKFPL